MFQYPAHWIHAIWNAETITVLALCAIFFAGAFCDRIYLWATGRGKRR